MGVFLAASFVIAAAHAAQRPFAIDDIFRMESIADFYRFSPDGRLLAFVRMRPVAGEPQHHHTWSNERSDVWLFDRQQGTLTNLTRGENDRSGSWYPAWSPDGARLAMVSTRNDPDRNPHVWIWERAGGRLFQLGNDLIDIDEHQATPKQTPHEIHWVSNTRLTYPALPWGERPIDGGTTRQQIAEITALWNKKMQGVEPSAAVYDAGRPFDAGELTHGEKHVACDVLTGACTDVLQSWIRRSLFGNYGRPAVIPSADGARLAVFAIAGSFPPDPRRTQRRINTHHYRLHVIDARGELELPDLKDMQNAVPGSLRWSADSSRVAFVGSFDPRLDVVGTQEGEEFGPKDVFVLDLKSGRLEQRPTPGLLPLTESRVRFAPLQRRFRLLWTRAGEVVLAAKQTDASEQEGWWLLRRSGAPVNLTARLGFMPEQLYPSDNGSFVCVGRGNVWRVGANGLVRQLTSYPADGALSIAWTDAQLDRGERIRKLVYRLGTQSPGRWYRLDVASGESRLLQTPAEQAQFQEFFAADDRAVFVQNERDGTRLWLAGTAGTATQTVLHTNTFLQDIAEGELRRIEYTSLDGAPLTAWILLPINYQPGRRYPTVCWVYQGKVQNEEPPDLGRITTRNPLNLQTLAANGYAVLFPSMPGKFYHYDRLLNGVIPAIDRAIDLGVADPMRLAVMGQSNGGFSTYGLITLTNRFKAAVALAGFPDFFSLTLTFNGYAVGRPRLEGSPEGRIAFMESEMDFGLPWRSNAYLTNSPITYVERVQTPLLMLHGDMDGVPVQQAQEFFVALQRLGKRARFVEYFGDDHVLHSPANIKHSWAQILGWFGEFTE